MHLARPAARSLKLAAACDCVPSRSPKPPGRDAQPSALGSEHAQHHPAAIPLNVSFGAGRFLGTVSTNYALPSLDGISWTSNAVVLPTRIGRVKFSEGLFLALTDSGELAISSDGLAWTKLPRNRTSLARRA